MSTTPLALPCLKRVMSGLYRAVAGPIVLTLADVTGNTDFDLTHCRVSELTTPPVVVPHTSLTAKSWSFTLAKDKEYALQLVVAQHPTFSSKVNLQACGLTLMVLDQTNQIQTWTVVS